jgi:branched-chain amino acid transport system permease protein
MSAAVGAWWLVVSRRWCLEPNMMLGVLLPGGPPARVRWALIGGGAVAGGFAVGVIENLAGTFIPYVGRELKLTIALVLIVAVLMVKPSGVFGRTAVSRV